MSIRSTNSKIPNQLTALLWLLHTLYQGVKHEFGI
jgi:hypothetical protein